MIFLLLINTYQAFRMIYLKNTDNMFLTNIKNNLCLEKSTLDNIKWQNVVVHKRKLYFVTDSIYYTVAMSFKDIYVRIVEVKSFQEKRIGMYQTKKIVDLFGLNKKEESNGSNGGGIGGGGEGSGNSYPNSNVSSNPSSNHNSIFNPSTNSSTNSISGSVFSTNQSSNDSQRSMATQRANNRLFSLNGNNMRTPTVPTITSYTQITKTKEKKPSQPKDKEETDEDDRNTRRLKQRKKKIREDFHVDSDSSLEEYENGCVYKDAKIKEVDGKYFQLVVNEEFCVTRFEGKFIFAPCSENDGQYFSMARGNEILTQLKKQKEKEMFLEVSKVGLLDNIDANVERLNEFIKSKNLNDLVGKTDALNTLNDQPLRNTNSYSSNSNSLLRNTNNSPENTDSILRNTNSYPSNSNSLLRSTNNSPENTDSILKNINTLPKNTDRNTNTEEWSNEGTKNKISLQNTQRLKQLLKAVNPDISDDLLDKILKINKNEPEKENIFGFKNIQNYNETPHSSSVIPNIQKDENKLFGPQMTESIFSKENTMNNNYDNKNVSNTAGNTNTDLVYPFKNFQSINTNKPINYNDTPYKLPDKEISKEVNSKETVKFKLKDLSKRPSFFTTQKIEGKPIDGKPANSLPLNLTKLISSTQKSLKNTELSKNRSGVVSNTYTKSNVVSDDSYNKIKSNAVSEESYNRNKSNVLSDESDSTFGNLKEDIAKTESMFGSLRADTLEGSSDKEDFISKLQKTFRENSF